MMKSIIMFLAALTMGSCLSVGASIPRVDLADLVPTAEQKQATSLITYLMAKYHYKKTPLDDELSEALLDRYLESLDPNRNYFLEADISAYETYRDRLDDSLRQARVEPAFEVFRIFRTRLEERVAYALGLLEQPFDFAISEQYQFDRTEAPWARDREELDEIWRKRVKNDFLSLRLAGQSEEEIIDTLRKRYQDLIRRTAQLNANDVYQLFMNAYTRSIEPHTAYFSPRISENFEISMSLSLEGIGAVLEMDNEYTLVRRVVPGGPADESGLLHAGDRIVGVGQDGQDGQDAAKPVVAVVGWRLDDVVDLIRGPKGSLVRLRILPKGTGLDEPGKLITLTRNRINLEEQAAQKSIIEITVDGAAMRIGVIDVPTFYLDFGARARGDVDYRSTTRDVRRLIAELVKERIDGLVIDLRGNGGGSLAEATELTGLFIETGPIVQVKDSAGQIEINEDPDPDIAYSGPLAVLVDRNSASASEIFAGAIQDYQRGVVIGEPTYGKGTVQSLVDLDRYTRQSDSAIGQLKLTIAQFFRISGASTQHRGVVPDIVYPTAFDVADQGERSLDNALPWATVHAVEFVPHQPSYGDLSQVLLRHEQRVQTDPAFRYLLREAESHREAADRTTVTLVEAERRTEQDARESERLERQNEFRIARGLEPLENDTKGEEEAQDEENSRDDEEEDVDVLLNEAVNILGDVIAIKLSPSNLAQTTEETRADIASQIP